MESAKKMSYMVSVILLVIGLGLGYGIGKSMNMKSSSTSQTASSTTKAADLRATLVGYGVEHMTLTDEAVADALDGSPAASATGAALYKNGTDIGAAVGSIYGKDAETTFNTVWKLHLDEFVAYAVADKQGDTAGADAALAKIDSGYTKPLAMYLAKANPKLPEATLESALREHVAMTANMIDMHVKGDYTGEASELAMANQHMVELFSTLAGGIVQQYPDKFKD